MLINYSHPVYPDQCFGDKVIAGTRPDGRQGYTLVENSVTGHGETRQQLETNSALGREEKTQQLETNCVVGHEERRQQLETNSVTGY